MGAPRQPSAAPWPGAEDSSAASPQPTPPAAAVSDLPFNSALFPPADHRQVAETRDPAIRPPALLLPSDRQPLEKREQKGSLGHAQALTSSCKFPLPAACGWTPGSSLFLLRRALCLGVRFSPTALPASHSLTRLAHRLTHTHPPNSTSEERVEKQRMK